MRLTHLPNLSTIFNQTTLHQPAFLAWIVLSLGIGIADYIIPTSFLSRLYNGFWTGAIIFSISAGIILLPRFHFCVFLFFVAGILISTQSESRYQKFERDVMQGQQRLESTHIQGRSIDQSLPLLNYYRTTISVSTLTGPNGSIDLRGKKFRFYSEIPIPQNSLLSIEGTVKLPLRRYFPGSFDTPRNYRALHLWGSIYADSIRIEKQSASAFMHFGQSFRSYVHRILDEFQNPAHASILQASFLGEKLYLSEDLKSIFRKAGIFHLLAISGLHMAILVMISLFFLAAFPINPGRKKVITLTLVWSYVLFIGPIPSLVRAAVMVTIISLTYFFQRKQYLLNTLGVAGCIWLVFSPESLFTPGYQLSFTATAFIIFAQPVIKYLISHLPQFPFKPTTNFLIGSLMVSTAGFLGTAPILHVHFGTVPVVGLITNVAAVFCMALSMCIFSVGICFFWLLPGPTSWLISAASCPLDLMIWLAETSTTLKQAPLLPAAPKSVWIVYYLFFVGMIVIRSRFIKRYILWAFPLFLITSATLILLQRNRDYVEITLFNTGKYNMAGISYSNGSKWVIGTPDLKQWEYTCSNRITPWQRQNRTNPLDLFIMARAETNPVHCLAPIFINDIPNILITSHLKLPNRFTTRDLSDFLTTYGTRHIQIRESATLYPMAGCTASVKVVSHLNRTELAIDLKIGDFQLSFLPFSSNNQPESNNEGMLNMKIYLDSPIIITGAPLSQVSKLNISKGAGRVRIWRNGNFQIHQFTGNKWEKS